MPDGQNIKVTFGAIEEAGGNIDATAKKMDSELDALRSQLAPLAEAYVGASRDAWRAVQESWERAQEELNQVLASIGAATKQAADDYRMTEGNVGKLWG
ncbi:WXG100 family type VII secretion target [Kibdelosporangium banguiense]|uniref:ESAT-6-like protein n=1 Tax=Kibdelosporangium banguiense TaxID=1365924 RepID=A0ABS4TDM1_9PSEU|nr:WXG100 family type VII secretion target [Kibdelosporangium banguiense]MBP2322507.1 WXG100 family type VII secretion target [Kibdelosporangium banguiense]